jgi:hypothetical protein
MPAKCLTNHTATCGFPGVHSGIWLRGRSLRARVPLAIVPLGILPSIWEDRYAASSNSRGAKSPDQINLLCGQRRDQGRMSCTESAFLITRAAVRSARPRRSWWLCQIGSSVTMHQAGHFFAEGQRERGHQRRMPMRRNALGTCPDRRSFESTRGSRRGSGSGFDRDPRVGPKATTRQGVLREPWSWRREAYSASLEQCSRSILASDGGGKGEEGRGPLARRGAGCGLGIDGVDGIPPRAAGRDDSHHADHQPGTPVHFRTLRSRHSFP